MTHKDEFQHFVKDEKKREETTEVSVSASVSDTKVSVLTLINKNWYWCITN